MFSSSYPDINIPETDLLSFVLEKELQLDQQKPIFIDVDDLRRSYSLSTLRSHARSFATGLAEKFDFIAGDTVAIFSANSIEYPMIVFGTFYARGVVTLVNPVYRKEEVAHQLRDSKAKLIYTTSELLPTTLAACELVGLDSSKVIVTSDKSSLGTSLSSMLTGKECTSGSYPSPNDLAFLCYSSGTTGLSKGVKLSHQNLVANLCQWDAGERHLNANSSVISVLPFSHIYALNVLIMNPLRRGMTSYVMPRFAPEHFLQLIQQHKITASFIVPPIVKALISPQAHQYDLSSLNFLCSGAAPLSPDLAKELCDLYTLSISQGFGLTETSPVLCYERFDAPEYNGYNGSVGKLLPNIELRIINEQGIEQDLLGHGELQVRGPNVMQGYLNNDAANLNAFTKDGFFKTGDLGYVGSDGCIYLVDRIKELIKYKGFQVPPVEIENLLLTHPAIQDCAVIGRNCDVEVTELPTAFCVLKPSALQSLSALPSGWTELDTEGQSVVNLEQVLARELMNFVAQKVANYKKLRGGIVFTDSIPRVPAGKILRRVLKERKGIQFLV